uniref:Uncharacterized protein n=1 Tax=Nelumbo nucifera TaxID=4432 RepID=A0A822XYU1_NELNU|nr:TPA_asm: hypothetical protein HUJ06_025408 [Nelumbo nucifera]
MGFLAVGFLMLAVLLSMQRMQDAAGYMGQKMEMMTEKVLHPNPKLKSICILAGDRYRSGIFAHWPRGGNTTLCNFQPVGPCNYHHRFSSDGVPHGGFLEANGVIVYVLVTEVLNGRDNDNSARLRTLD